MSIIVVDNGSSMPFSPIAAEELIVIRNDENLGYAGGANTGIREAIKLDFEFLWLLNTDVDFNETTLPSLIEHMELNKGVAAVSPVIYNLENKEKIQYAGASLLHEQRNIKYWKLSEQHDDDNSLLWGTALLIRVDSILKIGLFNEDYFAYWEDFEFSVRLIKAGYKTAIVKKSKLWHKWGSEEQISRRPPYFYYYMTRNGIYFYLKALSYQSNKTSVYFTCFVDLLETIVGRLDRNDKESAQAALQGYIEACKKKVGPYKEAKFPIISFFVFLAPFRLHRLLKKLHNR